MDEYHHYQDIIKKYQEIILETEKKSISEWRLNQLVYLLQQNGDDFDQYYKCSRFGIKSETFTEDLRYAIAKGILIKKDDEIWIPPLFEAKKLDSDNSNLSSCGKSCVRKFMNSQKECLDALSTLIYLAKDSYKGEGLRQKFFEIRPDLADHYNEAYKSACEFPNFL
jgi:hypothetical protein